MCCGHQSISGANISIKKRNISLKFTEFILKFTENAKKWLLKGEKGVKKVILVNGKFSELSIIISYR